MSETKNYLAVTSLSVPRYDDEGKVTTKNLFVRGGDPVALDTKLHSELIERGLQTGSLVEAPDKQEPESREGDEVNGPGASTLIGTPALDGATVGRLARPGNEGSYAEWVAFAKQEGLDTAGGKAAIIERADQADKDAAEKAKAEAAQD